MGVGHSSISARLLESLREKNGEVSQDDEDFAAKVTSNIYAGECVCNTIQFKVLSNQIIFAYRRS